MGKEITVPPNDPIFLTLQKSLWISRSLTPRQEWLIDEIKNALTILTAKEMLVIGFVMDGIPVNKIASCMRISRGRVYQIRRASYRKIRTRLKKNKIC